MIRDTLIRLLFILLMLPAIANAQGINRCVQNGKTIFTDKPCSDPMQIPQSGAVPRSATPSSPSSVSDASLPTTPYGEWHGQTQFQMTSRGQRVGEAHSVVPMTIAIDQQGKVIGASPDNGCRLLGVAAPGATGTLLNLDISFSGCRYAAFNRRFSGTLAYYVRDKAAQLNLNSTSAMAGEHLDVRATMRR